MCAAPLPGTGRSAFLFNERVRPASSLSFDESTVLTQAACADYILVPVSMLLHCSVGSGCRFTTQVRCVC